MGLLVSVGLLLPLDFLNTLEQKDSTLVSEFRLSAEAPLLSMSTLLFNFTLAKLGVLLQSGLVGADVERHASLNTGELV